MKESSSLSGAAAFDSIEQITDMKAFWWFKDKSIAGMARPGFNQVQWFDLPFEETLIYGWLGQRSCGTESVANLMKHFAEYGAKIRGFHKIDESTFARMCGDYEKPGRLHEGFKKVAARTGCIEHFEVNGDTVSFKLNRSRLAKEIEFLKANKIRSIVSLTENHNQREELERHFHAHHLAIEDLNAPRIEQAEELAGIINGAKAKGGGIAVHCMAGIGRTSTMLIAAHLVLGENLEDLLERVAKANPLFKLTGPQEDFVRAVALGSESN